jgi:replication-associated recombination protein RarA
MRLRVHLHAAFIWGPPGLGKTKTIRVIGGHVVDR